MKNKNSIVATTLLTISLLLVAQTVPATSDKSQVLRFESYELDVTQLRDLGRSERIILYKEIADAECNYWQIQNLFVEYQKCIINRFNFEFKKWEFLIR